MASHASAQLRRTNALAHGENGPINLVRILAALLVALGHARTLLFVDYDDAPHNLLQAALYGVSAVGHQAVVVFFVLSGYWVGGSVGRKIRSGSFVWREYLMARVVRLWVVLVPALILTFVLDSIGRSLFGSMSAYAGDRAYGGVAMDHRPLDLFTFIGNMFFMGGVRVWTLGSNTALWSLGYEFWMYILAPLLMVLAACRWPRRAVLLLIFVVAGFVVGVPVLVYLPMWLLGAGIAAWKGRLDATAQGIPPRTLALVRVLACGLTLGAAVAVRGLNSLPVWLGDYIVAIPAGFLLASLTTGFIKASTEKSVVGRFSKLANSSYSIYAIHVPILVMLTCLLGVQVHNRWPSDLVHWAYLGLILVGVGAVGWLFAQLTERHTSTVRNWVRRSLFKSSYSAADSAS